MWIKLTHGTTGKPIYFNAQQITAVTQHWDVPEKTAVATVGDSLPWQVKETVDEVMSKVKEVESGFTDEWEKEMQRMKDNKDQVVYYRHFCVGCYYDWWDDEPNPERCPKCKRAYNPMNGGKKDGRDHRERGE